MLDKTKITINGRTFSEKSDRSNHNHYGKSELATYVYINWKTVDLSNYKKILDQICEVKCDYDKWRYESTRDIETSIE